MNNNTHNSTHEDEISIPTQHSESEIAHWKKLIDLLRFLRSKEGCPWDQTQTLASLRPHMIEEQTELLECIGRILDSSDPAQESKIHTELQEEMGDVMLVLVMTMIIYEDEYNKEGALADVIESLNKKIIRRHPHVFGDIVINNSNELAAQWNKIKTDNEGKKEVSLSQYKDYMHIFERTKEIQKKLSKEHNILLEPITEKLQAVQNQLNLLFDSIDEIPPKGDYRPTPPHIEKMFSRMFFQIIDIAREFKVSPTASLSRELASYIDKYGNY